MILGAGALLVAPLAPSVGYALTDAEARALVGQVMDDIRALVESGRSEAELFVEFERIFDRYGDVPTIARSVLGPAARTASSGQLQAFTAAFRTYMARKYGRQFRRIAGARVEVTGAREVQRYFEVISTVYMRGEPPFEVRWHVSDRSGARRFFNMIIDGVNVLAAERQEIGTMLERRRGNLDQLIEDLRRVV